MPQYVEGSRCQDVSGTFRTTAAERVPRSGMHYSTPTNQTTLWLQYSVSNDTAFYTCVTYYIDIFRCLLSLPIAAVLFSWIGFVILSSQCSLLIGMFVFDIMHVPTGCSRIRRGYSAHTCTPLATGLSGRSPSSVLKYLFISENACLN
jgi:hypothetical protein